MKKLEDLYNGVSTSVTTKLAELTDLYNRALESVLNFLRRLANYLEK